MINPYEPPKSKLETTDFSPIQYFGLYKAVNNVYAFVMVACLLILIFGNRLVPEIGTLYVLVSFFTPVYAYYLVRKAFIHRLNVFLKVYSLLVFSLFAVFAYILPEKRFDQGIGYFMIGVYVASFAYTKWWHRTITSRSS